MSIVYYDKHNQEVSLEEYVKLFEDMDYRRIGYTHIGCYVVSTVWTGTLGISTYAFETMVFNNEKGDFLDIDCDQYLGEQDAAQGHTRMVYRWAKIASKEKSNED